MIDIANLWKYELRHGNTDHPRNGACLFDAGMWLVYGKIGDNPPCSCPIIRQYGIALNDDMDDAQRQRLKPFILRVVGNRDPEAEAARLHFIILETARRVVSLALDRMLSEHAAILRALPNDSTYSQIADAVRTAARAADAAARAAARAAYAYAYAYADAADDAADATYAIDANAARAADATYATYAYAARAADAARVANNAANAANAADAADAAIDANAARAVRAAANAVRVEAAANAAAPIWDQAIWILDNVLRIGKQAPEFDERQVCDSILAFENAHRS